MVTSNKAVLLNSTKSISLCFAINPADPCNSPSGCGCQIENSQTSFFFSPPFIRTLSMTHAAKEMALWCASATLVNERASGGRPVLASLSPSEMVRK